MKLFLKLSLIALTVLSLSLAGCRPPELESAVMEFNKGRYESAKEKAKVATEKNPEVAEGWWIYGISSIETAKSLDDYSTGKHALDKAKELDTKTYGKKAEDYQYSQYGNSYNLSVKYFNQASALTSGDSANVVLDKVIEKAQIAAIFKPEKAAIYTLIARSYLTMKNTDQAGEYYQKAYEMGPDSLSIQFDLAYFLFSQKKDYKGAIIYFDKIVANPKDSEAANTFKNDSYQLLAACYDALGEPEKIKEAYINALSINPDNDKINFNLGTIYFQEQNLADAEKHFTSALDTGMDTPEVYLYLGNCRNVLHKYDEAREVLEMGVSKYPDNGEMWNQLGKAYAHLNLRKEAEAAFKKAKDSE